MEEASDSPGSLLSRIASGDNVAEKELVATYRRGLLFVLKRHTRDETLAQDLAQDTLIVVIQKARSGQIRSDQALSAFVRQTGINLYIAYCRKKQRQKTDATQDIHSLFADTDSSYADKISYQQLLALVTQLFDELPNQRDRDLLKAYYLSDKSKNELCENLLLTPEHFDRVLYRARQRLKQLLAHRFQIDTKHVSLSNFLYISVLSAIFILSLAGYTKKSSFQVGAAGPTQHFTCIATRVCVLQSKQYERWGMPL